MSSGTIVAIVIAVIVVAALIAVVALSTRRHRLQKRFGPEYDRAVQDSDSRLKAESALAERERRVRKLDIRALDPAARDRYAAQWTGIQQQFVDSPADAVTGGQSLITDVMRERGYPTDDADQIMADLSVEHASTIDHFRTAQDLSGLAADGSASTEDLRLAMVHYRALFQELLGVPGSADGAVTATGPADAADIEYQSDDTPVAVDDPDGEAARARAAGDTAVTDDTEVDDPAVTTPDAPLTSAPAASDAELSEQAPTYESGPAADAPEADPAGARRRG